MKLIPVIGGLILLLSGCASFVSPGGISDRNCVGIMECSDEPEIIELPTHQKLINLPRLGIDYDPPNLSNIKKPNISQT